MHLGSRKWGLKIFKKWFFLHINCLQWEYTHCSCILKTQNINNLRIYPIVSELKIRYGFQKKSKAWSDENQAEPSEYLCKQTLPHHQTLTGSPRGFRRLCVIYAFLKLASCFILFFGLGVRRAASLLIYSVHLSGGFSAVALSAFWPRQVFAVRADMWPDV